MTTALTARRAILAPGGWVRNDLWRRARAVPSLDLRFAESKSLVDATTGQNLVTFTRASSGTYVGSDGLIKTATTNLLTYSEDFTNAAWTSNNSSRQGNVVIAPNGTITADKLIEDSTTTFHSLSRGGGSESLVTGLVYTFSVYAKAAERTFVYLQGTSNYAKSYFNLSTGVVSAVGSGHIASIAAVGNGWYRCSITFTSDATANTIRAIGMSIVSGTESYTGDGTSGVYIWGAQLEQSSTVGEYIPTTSTINSAPRFDHNPTTGESLGLLVEEQRTNLLLRSEEFSNTAWTGFGASVSADTRLSPNGSVNADTLTENNGNNLHEIYITSPLSTTSGVAYTASVYAKQGTNSEFKLVFDLTGATGGVFFNLNTGTVILADAGYSGSIQALADGWYRCIVTMTAGTTASRFFAVVHSSGSQTLSYTGTSRTIHVWGAQLEAGAFPTSYIPTTTATVTRSADVASITGTNFSSWYRQDEGTIAVTCQRPSASSNVAQVVVGLSDGSTNNEWRLRFRNLANNFTVAIRSGGVEQYSPFDAGTELGLGVRQTLSLTVAANDAAVVCNGAVVSNDTSLNLPIGINSLNIAGSLPLNGTFNRYTYWPQRLSNSTLQTITQP